MIVKFTGTILFVIALILATKTWQFVVLAFGGGFVLGTEFCLWWVDRTIRKLQRAKDLRDLVE